MREEKRGRRRERERVLRTDEDARLRESVLSEPFVERFSNVSREFEVLLLIFSYRDVGSSVEKQGPSISQRRGKRRGREEERERRQDELVKQDICRLENRVGEKTEMELIVRDFGYRSVLLISDFALGKGRTTDGELELEREKGRRENEDESSHLPSSHPVQLAHRSNRVEDPSEFSMFRDLFYQRSPKD